MERHTRYTVEKARSPAWTDSKLPAWGTRGAAPRDGLLAPVRKSSGREGRAGRPGRRGELRDASLDWVLVGGVEKLEVDYRDVRGRRNCSEAMGLLGR